MAKRKSSKTRKGRRARPLLENRVEIVQTLRLYHEYRQNGESVGEPVLMAVAEVTDITPLDDAITQYKITGVTKPLQLFSGKPHRYSERDWFRPDAGMSRLYEMANTLKGKTVTWGISPKIRRK